MLVGAEFAFGSGRRRDGQPRWSGGRACPPFPRRSVLVSINQQVARRRRAARREADARLADRLGGTWTLLTQVLTAASPPRTRPTGTTSHEAAPTADDTLSDP
jgi:hypothetical protein